jgi:hydrogenase maturation protein HypF
VVTGVVQGVGFRPFVWRIATDLRLAGSVANVGGRVEVHIEGPPAALDRFVAALPAEAPRLARVDAVEVAAAEVRGAARFEIIESTGAGAEGGARLVAPDAALCDDCRAEVLDPASRRHRYPFTSCASCGPRYTVICDLPYDRAATTLAGFPMCPACAAEHADPADRRFGAEPLACPACGPHLATPPRTTPPRTTTQPFPQPETTVFGANLAVEKLGGGGDGGGGGGGGGGDEDPIGVAAGVLRRGGIVAVKGLGGYQLACDARDEAAVARLRARKRRPDKPLAVLVVDLAAAHEVAEVSDDEAALLTSPAGPIVLVRSRGVLAPGVHPRQRRVGLLLPTTPLHLLLVAEVGGPVVLTSGNRSGQPICVDDDEALARLAGVADHWLTHDRPIAARYDDSVAAVRRRVPAVLRRARGTAPTTHRLPAPGRGLLAVGADIQSTVCVVAPNGTAVAGPHVGDLDDAAAIDAWHRSLAHLLHLTGVEPELVVHDAHPDLVSTRLAEELAGRWGVERLAVAHHEAHVAAVVAEHEADGVGRSGPVVGPVVGLAFDGTGWGSDGTVWGGEVLAGEPGAMVRVGHLRPVPLPGGDLAVRHPARVALAHAAAAGCVEAALACLGLAVDEPSDLLGGASPAAVLAQARTGVAAPPTSSVGRLLDAMAAMLGIAPAPTYEGQPAIELEQVAARRVPAVSPVQAVVARVAEPDGAWVLDPRPLVGWVAEQRAHGGDVGELAAATHRWLADGAVALAEAARAEVGDVAVCLGGGVWANDLLLDAVVDGLEARDVEVWWPRQVPPGDGGIALGQARVAAAVVQRGGLTRGTMEPAAPAGALVGRS